MIKKMNSLSKSMVFWVLIEFTTENQILFKGGKEERSPEDTPPLLL